MKIPDELLGKLETDLCLDAPFVKGENFHIKNCWHFCTDGNAVDALFHDEQDFIDGMNRLYVVSRKFGIAILAFVLMDTHIHLIVFGDNSECRSFVHEYLRRTSMHLSRKHLRTNMLKRIPVTVQEIRDDFYLKKAICYVIKNPVSAGLPFMPYDYPWSSGALYFRTKGFWNSVGTSFSRGLEKMSIPERRARLKTRNTAGLNPLMNGNLVFPEEYVAVEIVERIFRSCRSYSYFMWNSREDDLNPLGQAASRMSIPFSEMRQLRDETSQELFNKKGLKNLNMTQRIKLARTLRFRYNCSAKQVIRICGLIYEEARDMI